MSANAIAKKYYELLVKLYSNINNDNIKWSKAINAEFFTAEINYRFKMRIYKAVDNLAANYIFRMYDDGGIKILEITSNDNGKDEVLVNDKTMKIVDILEEIYEWARAYSLDIVEKVDQAGEMLDALTSLTDK